MKALNRERILASVTDRSEDLLMITHFDERMLQHASYYFRLGRRYSPQPRTSRTMDSVTMADGDVISLTGHGYTVIESYERFTLSSRTLAIIGPSSDLVDSGLLMVHGPVVDPLFDGRLSLGLWNLSPVVVELTVTQVIGKLIFFDISDSGPIEVVPGSSIDMKFKRRKQMLRDDDPVHDVDETVDESNPWEV